MKLVEKGEFAETNPSPGIASIDAISGLSHKGRGDPSLLR
jgi:hypothetical protein